MQSHRIYKQEGFYHDRLLLLFRAAKLEIIREIHSVKLPLLLGKTFIQWAYLSCNIELADAISTYYQVPKSQVNLEKKNILHLLVIEESKVNNIDITP